MKYQEVKRGWSDTVLNGLKGTTEVLNTINSAVQKVLDSPIINWAIAITAVASTIACPPAGSATIPACTAILTRRAVARLAPAASVLVAREIGRQVGKDATQLQIQFNILYNKKHNNNNGNNRNNNGTNSNAGTSNNAPRVIREYKAGTSWDKMQPVNTSEAQRKFGKLNKQAFRGGELRTDGKDVYRFDNGHKTAKVHLERYRQLRNNVWQGYWEVDSVTGKVLEGSVEKTAKRIITW